MQIAQVPRAVLHPEQNEWLRGFAKAGYAVKGFVYGLIGVLAIQVALGQGGELAGEHEAVRHVQHQPFGDILLLIIGVGLLGYSVWRILEGALDLPRYGRGAKAMAQRFGCVMAGLANGTAAIATLQLGLGGVLGSPGKSDQRSWISELMNDSLGLVVLAGIGVGIVIAGGAQIYNGYSRYFLRDLRISGAPPETQRWVVRLGQVGHIARGVVFMIIGVTLVHAVLTTDPSEARTFGEALGEIASQPFGTLLLAGVAVGLLGYGAFLVITTPYRRLGDAAGSAR